MADRLLGKGHTVTGYNRTQVEGAVAPRQGDEVGRLAARRRGSRRHHLRDGHRLHGARSRSPSGPDGLVAGLGPGKIVDRHEHGEPGDEPGARREGARARAPTWSTAPVSGSVVTLEQGKLTMMVGGDAPTVRPRCSRCSSTSARKATYVGDNGLAVSMKIAINLSLAVQMLAFSEGGAAGGEGGHRAQDRGRGADQQRHRLADGAVPRPDGARPARGGLVRHEDDAEGHDAGARDGPAARRAAADDRRHQRVPHRRARPPDSRRRISPPCSRCSPSCQE